ncbi:6007_t:CDS:10 [Entrophospora sp. SA101]|nr:6007_t:CDS:10 [Entrophospora sp. SA101]
MTLNKDPYPYPQNIIYSNNHNNNDDSIFGEAYPDGLIKQFKRPLDLILSPGNTDPNNKWKLLYVHRLEGPITHISSFYHDNGTQLTNFNYKENNALAILYQTQSNEQIKFFLRLYNIGNYDDDDYDTVIDSIYTCNNTPSFKYQDLLLPDLLEIESSESGPIQRIKKNLPNVQTSTVLRRVYAVPGVIRVLNATVIANEENWIFEVSVTHNSTYTDAVDGIKDSNWRTKSLRIYTPSIKRSSSDIEFVYGLTPSQPVSVPKPIVVTARNVTTICIALNNILFTFDYSNAPTTDENQETHLTEAYTVRSEYLPVLDEWSLQVIGTEINTNGDLLILVTQENYILVYKRELADLRLPASAKPRRGFFDKFVYNDQIYSSHHPTKVNDDPWELRMVITASHLEFLCLNELDVIAVKILNISKSESSLSEKNIMFGNILFILFENGNVATFNLDKGEQEMKLGIVIRKQWQMYLESQMEVDDFDNNVDNDDNYEEEVSYIILDLGTEVTLDMIMSKNRMNNININDSDEQQQATSSNKVVAGVNVSNDDGSDVQQQDLPENTNANQNSITYSLIGLETDAPYLRIGSLYFKGEFDEMIGTDLVFSQEPAVLIIINNPRLRLKSHPLVYHSNRKLHDDMAKSKELIVIIIPLAILIKSDLKF